MLLNDFFKVTKWPHASAKTVKIYTETPEFEVDLTRLQRLTSVDLTVFRNSSLQNFLKTELYMPRVSATSSSHGSLKRLEHVQLLFSEFDSQFYWLDELLEHCRLRVNADKIIMANCNVTVRHDLKREQVAGHCYMIDQLIAQNLAIVGRGDQLLKYEVIERGDDEDSDDLALIADDDPKAYCKHRVDLQLSLPDGSSPSHCTLYLRNIVC